MQLIWAHICFHTNLGNNPSGDPEKWEHRQNDKREFPSMNKGIDERSYEYGHEEYEHAYFLPNTFLQFIQVPEKKTIWLD